MLRYSYFIIPKLLCHYKLDSINTIKSITGTWECFMSNWVGVSKIEKWI